MQPEIVSRSCPADVPRRLLVGRFGQQSLDQHSKTAANVEAHCRNPVIPCQYQGCYVRTPRLAAELASAIAVVSTSRPKSDAVRGTACCLISLSGRNLRQRRCASRKPGISEPGKAAAESNRLQIGVLITWVCCEELNAVRAPNGGSAGAAAS